MQSYGSGRKALIQVRILGWLVIALGILVGVLVAIIATLGAPAGFGHIGWPLLVPSLVLILLGSCAILLSHMARAVFDIAERGT
jgi:hypothetical protein